MEWTLPTQLEKAAFILNANGETVFLVGGAVRDLLLNQQPKDWDLVTSASLIKIQALFPQNFLMGKKQETINVFLDGLRLEISPYRSGSRTLEEDLSKRDFTINAMPYDLVSKTLIDPFSGTKDLQKNLLRAVGSAVDRFQEDPLRMLRALRLMAQYQLRLSPSLIQAIAQKSTLLSQVSMERIRDELAHILLTDQVTETITLAEKLGLLSIFLPELSACFGLEQNTFHNKDVAGHILNVIEHLPQDDLEMRLVGLLHDLGKPLTRSVGKDGRVHFYGHENYSAEIAKEVLKRLKISTRILDRPVSSERIILLVKNHMFFYPPGTSDKAVRRLLARLQPENIPDFLLLQRADILAGSPSKQERLPHLTQLALTISRILEENPPLQEKDLALTGKEIMSALQLPPGKKVGQIKKKLLQAVIDNPKLNNKVTLLKILAREKSTL